MFANLESLPNELILHILRFLSPEDIGRTARSSKRLRIICEAEILWKDLSFIRWRYWDDRRILSAHFSSFIGFDWKSIYVQRHIQDRELWSIVRSLPNVQLTRERVAKEKRVVSFGKQGHETLTHFYRETTNPQEKEFASKLIARLDEMAILEKWRQHLSVPEQERRLEDGAIIMAQGLGFPQLDANEVNRQLDEIAEGVSRRFTPADYTMHRRFLILNQYFFRELGFRGFDAEEFSPSNSFIQQVLETRRGIQISLALVYAVVARRLKIPITMIGMPRHFLTRYEGDGPYQNHYIDAFSGGVIFSQEELEKRSFPTRFLTVNSSEEIYVRLLRNLIEEYNGTGQVDQMLNALNQSISIMPQQEELAYRTVIHTDYTGQLDDAIQDLEQLLSLGSITQQGEETLRNKIQMAQKRLEMEEIQPMAF
jgi:regulator of sirC expression with transglutaminase-like and TPR domain